MRDVLTFDERLTSAAIDTGSVVDFVVLDPIEGVPELPEALALTGDFIVVDITARPATLVSDAGGYDVVVITSSGPAGPSGEGSPGPQGEPGVQGIAGGSFTYDQFVPSDTWTITHGLPYTPNAIVVDTAGSVLYGDIERLSASQIQLVFSVPISGTAYLS